MNFLENLLTIIFGARNQNSEAVKRLVARATSPDELERMRQGWERRAVRAL